MAATLSRTLDVLGELAPLALAEEWDNVGLLIEPARNRRVRRALLTVDLTNAVLDEAIAAGAELIVAYHPPIFAPLTRLVRGDPKARIALVCAARGIAVYTPHTALDPAPAGVNDWLADGLGAGERRALQPRDDHDRDVAAGTPVGQGRAVALSRPAALAALVRRIKRHVGLRKLRVATAARHAAGAPIESVALCAGAGGSVVGGVAADLYWTGEMRHHDVLAAVETGTSVVLCEHTNTERGYLPVLRERLLAAGLDVEIELAARDRGPLEVV